jgi:hypothetical protein
MSIASACDHCTKTSMWSASIVSFDPDGAHVRTYASRIRAIFGLTYYPGTYTPFASMNQRRPGRAHARRCARDVVPARTEVSRPHDQGGAGAAVSLASALTSTRRPGVAIVTGGLGPAVGRGRRLSGSSARSARALTSHGSGHTPKVSPS